MADTSRFVSTDVEPVVLDHYTEDELAFSGGTVRACGSGWLVVAGEGENMSFVAANTLVDAVRTIKSISPIRGDADG